MSSVGARAPGGLVGPTSVTIIRTEGSTPQRVGAKMLVYADGRSVGTIGGGCYENDAFWKARKALETRRPIVTRYELADDIAEESGLICGVYAPVSSSKCKRNGGKSCVCL